jgi:transposase InsO family protein
MARTNVGWGAPRIHGELRKLGIRVSEATVSRYMPKRVGPPGSNQRWSTFLDNHLRETLAVDFAVVPTITFGLMYVFFVLSLDRRRVLHFNVTKHPTANWTAHQVAEACGFEAPARYLLRDNDSIYGREFRRRIEQLGLEQIRTALRSPWQNGYAERWIGSLRRECLDHVLAINERQLRRVIREYVDYYHADRTHIGLDKDAPDERELEPPEVGKVIALPRVGGLHHRYSRRAA